jgi:hypothetical protein
MKTFVDNVCRQVIERHILGGLPDIFTPATAAAYSESDLIRIASETTESREKRAQLVALVNSLSKSLQDLRQ